LEKVFEAPEGEIITSYGWSYDSTRLAINTLLPNGAISTIFILNLDTAMYELIDTSSFDMQNTGTYQFDVWLPGSEIIALTSANLKNRRFFDLESNSPVGLKDFPGQIAYSPDGQYIAFFNYFNQYPDSRLEIVITNLQNEDSDHYIIASTEEYSPAASDLSWSADSLNLVFKVDIKEGDSRTDIYIIQTEMGIMTPITSSGYNDDPTWLSYDNILFLRASFIGMKQTLESHNIYTDCQVSISISPDTGSITVSPDGTQIAVLENWSIYISTTEKLIEYIDNKCK